MPLKQNQLYFNVKKIIVECKYFDFQITVKVLKIKSLLILKCGIDLKALFEISAGT